VIARDHEESNRREEKLVGTMPVFIINSRRPRFCGLGTKGEEKCKQSKEFG
jgi:hypothetical protein